MVTFESIKESAYTALNKKNLGNKYKDRLDLEISEIEKQGLERYWVNLVADGKVFGENKNDLVLPWLIGLLDDDAAKIDPIGDKDNVIYDTKYDYIQQYITKHKQLPSNIIHDSDNPDIDLDCLPAARDEIKDFAAKRYGEKKVVSVGTWQTFLFKRGVQDVADAIGLDRDEAIRLTADLPDNVNALSDDGYGVCIGKIIENGVEKECGCRHNQLECPICGSHDTETPTIARIIHENTDIQQYMSRSDKHIEVIDKAAKLIGRIRNRGKHAGAIVIADRDLFGNIPMIYDKNSGQWVSLWTEGRIPQLSKLGYTKWDILGLKNLQYIYECCKLVKQNHNISFGDRLEGWDKSDPERGVAGVYWKDNIEHEIGLNDPEVLRLASEQKTDSIFQFDTNLAKSTLSNGVRSFRDLLIFNAMGHPGPMACIPDYVERRDDDSASWKVGEHEKIIEILNDTHGIICFQEQLTDLWQQVAGFSGPEAQFARKAVAKKWKDKLKPIRQKWIDGATPVIGESAAISWWDDKMEAFGRYAFNKSHAVAYCLLAYKCLYFKRYFPEEWWACVMSLCKLDYITRYMNAARLEGVKFGSININKMTVNFTANAGNTAVDGADEVALGLISINNVGQKLAYQFADTEPQNYTDIDDFIEKKGKSKTLLERLIKLGAFKSLHSNVKATWYWYQFKYCTGKDVTKLRNEAKQRLLEIDGWDEKTIEEERARQVVEYKKCYPKRNKIPNKILNWKPNPNPTRERVMGLIAEDYKLVDILEFEKLYLGYYWHSPTDLYVTSGTNTAEHAKSNGVLQGVIIKRIDGKTKNDKRMIKLFINDGIGEFLVILWDNNIILQNNNLLQVNRGIELAVDYDESRNTFTLQRSTIIKPLWTKSRWDEFNGDDSDD